MSDPTTTPTPTEPNHDMRMVVDHAAAWAAVEANSFLRDAAKAEVQTILDDLAKPLAAVSAAAPDEREALAREHARVRRARTFHHHRYDSKPPQRNDYIAADVTLAALAARPAPVVSRVMADAAIEALGMNAYMTPERVAAHHAALGVVWTDPRTAADAPAADDEVARLRSEAEPIMVGFAADAMRLTAERDAARAEVAALRGRVADHDGLAEVLRGHQGRVTTMKGRRPILLCECGHELHFSAEAEAAHLADVVRAWMVQP